MKRILFPILIAMTIPLIAGNRGHNWRSGTIRVLSTDLWCGQSGVCGPGLGSHTQYGLWVWDGPYTPEPATLVLEIDGGDAVYIVRKAYLHGGPGIRPGSATQFAVEGTHLLVKFQREDYELDHGRPILHLYPEQDRTEIIEIRKR